MKRTDIICGHCQRKFATLFSFRMHCIGSWLSFDSHPESIPYTYTVTVKPVQPKKDYPMIIDVINYFKNFKENW